MWHAFSQTPFLWLSRRQNFRKHHAYYISDLLTKMVSLPLFLCLSLNKCSYLFFWEAYKFAVNISSYLMPRWNSLNQTYTWGCQDKEKNTAICPTWLYFFKAKPDHTTQPTILFFTTKRLASTFMFNTENQKGSGNVKHLSPSIPRCQLKTNLWKQFQLEIHYSYCSYQPTCRLI